VVKPKKKGKGTFPTNVGEKKRTHLTQKKYVVGAFSDPKTVAIREKGGALEKKKKRKRGRMNLAWKKEDGAGFNSKKKNLRG